MLCQYDDASALRPVWRELLHIQHSAHHISGEVRDVRTCDEVQLIVEWLEADGLELTRQGIEFLYILAIIYGFCIILGLFIHYEVPRRWRPIVWFLHIVSFVCLFLGTITETAHLIRMVMHDRIWHKIEQAGNACTAMFWCKEMCLRYTSEAPSMNRTATEYSTIIHRIAIFTGIAIFGVCVRIPRKLIHFATKKEDLKLNCPICLDSLAEKNAVKLMCQHVFHYDCVHKWFECSEEPECPVCRMEIVESAY